MSGPPAARERVVAIVPAFEAAATAGAVVRALVSGWPWGGSTLRPRRLCVSEAPHLRGRFVAFDLSELLDPSREAPLPASLATLSARVD